MGRLDSSGFPEVRLRTEIHNYGANLLHLGAQPIQTLPHAFTCLGSSGILGVSSDLTALVPLASLLFLHDHLECISYNTGLNLRVTITDSLSGGGVTL